MESSLIGGARLLFLYRLCKYLGIPFSNEDAKGGKQMVLSAALLGVLSVGLGGPRHSLVSKVTGITHREVAHVGGSVESGFEMVRGVFERNVKQGLELGAQFVVYYKGVKVVDLFGGTLREDEYNQDSVQICFSCSKVLASLVVAMEVDKGFLEYDEKVSTYWPAFAQHGKGDITVADVLRHEAGLPFFEEKIPIRLMERGNLDELADFIAGSKPLWERKFGQEKKRMYHGITRGFILNEIVRSVDPFKRSIGEIIRAELAEPNHLTISLGGRNESEKSITRDLRMNGFHHTILSEVYGMATGALPVDNFYRSLQFLDPKSDINQWMNCLNMTGQPYHNDDHYFNHEHFQDLEIPSVTVLSNARSLGRIADLMSRGSLLSVETQKLSHSEPTTKYDHGLCFETTFNKGGWCEFNGKEWNENCHGFIGWGGLGGSQLSWNTDNQIGVAYTMNGPILSSIMGFRDKRCLALMEATMKSIKKKEACAL